MGLYDSTWCSGLEAAEDEPDHLHQMLRLSKAPCHTLDHLNLVVDALQDPIGEPTAHVVHQTIEMTTNRRRQAVLAQGVLYIVR